VTGHPYQPQGAFCPVCGRHVALLIDGRLTVHTDPRLAYGPACIGTVPAVPARQVRP
jgi:hypothetical protein